MMVGAVATRWLCELGTGDFPAFIYIIFSLFHNHYLQFASLTQVVFSMPHILCRPFQSPL